MQSIIKKTDNESAAYSQFQLRAKLPNLDNFCGGSTLIPATSSDN